MSAPAVRSLALRARELAPDPETARRVREYLAVAPADAVEPFLRGMLAAKGEDPDYTPPAEDPPPPAPSQPAESITRTSPADEVVSWCRERLGLVPEEETAADKAWRKKHVGTFDVDEDGRVWVTFPRRPRADVRKKVKAAGFWWMKRSKAWCHPPPKMEPRQAQRAA